MSAYEPCRNSSVQKCGKRSYCGVDSDNDNQFSYGSVLATLFAGPVVRTVFSLIFREKKALQKDETKETPEVEVQ